MNRMVSRTLAQNLDICVLHALLGHVEIRLYLKKLQTVTGQRSLERKNGQPEMVAI